MKKDISNLYEEQKRKRFIHVKEMQAILGKNTIKIKNIKTKCNEKAKKMGLELPPRGCTYRKFFNELTDPDYKPE